MAGSQTAHLATLAERLAGVIADTEADLASMPFFVRPMVKRGFARRSGKTFAEWKALADELARQARGAGLTRARLGAELPVLLAGLEDHYRTAPERAARGMGGDREALRVVTERARQREAAVRELREAIAALA